LSSSVEEPSEPVVDVVQLLALDLHTFRHSQDWLDPVVHSVLVKLEGFSNLTHLEFCPFHFDIVRLHGHSVDSVVESFLIPIDCEF